MFQIFGRTPLTQHPLEHPLRAILERQDAYTAGDRAVAFNLMDDYRISPDREAEFLPFTGAAPDSLGLKNGLTRYYRDQIRNTDSPAFLAGSNFNNQIPIGLGDPDHPGLHPELFLGRVLNLSGLRPVFLRNLDTSDEFREFADRKDDEVYYGEWLAQKCSGSEDEKERFVAAVLGMLKDDQKNFPYHPAWAAPWDDLEPFLALGATRWRQILGLKPDQAGPAWLIVLKYRVCEAGQLFRPTQLDANWYECHFPSPAQLQLEQGGLTMDLASVSKSLVRELIHRQAEHDVSQWIAGERRIGLAQMMDPLNLTAQRQWHHEVLTDTFGEAARLWRY